MQRLLSGAMGALLLFGPAQMAYNMALPVPQYRTGSYADYQTFVLVCLTIYGGAAIGIIALWRRRVRRQQTHNAVSVFWAGFTGAIIAVGVAMMLASVQKGPGNLWGLVVIVGGVFGAIVGAGAGLVWYACFGPTRMIQP